MYMAYFDESGDPGYSNSPSRDLGLACCLVPDSHWLPALDALRDFRTSLKDDFGIPMDAELKANFLLHEKGIFKRIHLPRQDRLAIYKRGMATLRDSKHFRVFAVVIDKQRITVTSRDSRDFAWQYALERLQTYMSKKKSYVHVLPDEGHGYFIRRKLRKMRRFHKVQSHYGTSVLDCATTTILDDPSDRRSEWSYFIQMADLCAYAAVRTVHPTPRFDDTMWNTLGKSRIRQVTRFARGPVGIKVFP